MQIRAAVTETYDFDAIDEAVADVESGRTVKCRAVHVNRSDHA